MVRYEAIFHEKGYAIFVGRRLESHYRATGSVKGVTIDPQTKRLVFDGSTSKITNKRSEI